MDFADQVREYARIEDVVGEVVRLKKSGTQRYTGLCPFHNEKRPSFTVQVQLQIYKCFSCGEGGDVFKFVMKTQGVTFPEALKLLAERYGIPMPQRSAYADEDARKRGALLTMHELAQETFRANLRSASGETARNYLAKRGLAPETVEQFGLGYSDRSGHTLLRLFEQRNFSVSQMVDSGLIGQSEDGRLYETFRHRVMFPIHNEAGKLVAYGGRALDDDPRKYLNSRGTDIYQKSHVLFNLQRAKEAIRKEDRVILVEGYMDVIGVSAAGFGAVVASCGTALTADQVRALKRHTQRILVNFDPDGPGSRAAEKSIGMLLEEGMQPRIVELDDGLDPDEYCRDRGAAAYQDKLDNAKGYFYWMADRARSKYDIRTQEGVVGLLQTLVPAVRLITDPLARAAMADDLAEYVGVQRGVVLDSFRKSVANRNENMAERARPVLRPDERIVLQSLFLDAEHADEILRELKSIDNLGQIPTRRIFQAIFAYRSGAANGEPLSYEQVQGRLQDGDRELLDEAVIREDSTASTEEVAAAVASLRRVETEDQRKQMKLRIKELERGGKWEDALRLTAELQELERRVRSAR